MSDILKRWMMGVKLAGDSMRPLLTFFITLFFNGTVTWAVFVGKLSVTDYIQAVGPINTMILGFWFAEKAALARPQGHTKDVP
ncbi:hypothetical protein [Cupriavidus campinensis]|uniref:Uncharacterized protein n=1 Tax=Cupriavidus campinensis TaxID=151783 RepID=A0ABY3ESZ4_9BURK|nr:hypothetical protein [Cupriavidus campinensis]TSP13969.1 hypothetical protein FGG12_05720 [Cupriavidus campinensis]